MIGATLFLLAMSAPQCEYKLSHTYQTVSAWGITSSVQILTQPGCPWSIEEEFPWMRILSPRSGTGPATVTFKAGPNPSPISRTGYIFGYAGSKSEPAFQFTVIVFSR